MRQQRHKLYSAFTLIELLVVVAIIALLISILLPSLSRAKKQAQSVKCLSNLRTLGQGVLTFTAEYKDRLVGDRNPPPGMPGGLFEGIYRNQGVEALMEKKSWSYEFAKKFQYRQLTYKLRSMFGDSDAEANSITDDVSTCPSSASFNPDIEEDDITYDGRYIFPMNYTINNIGTVEDQGGPSGGRRSTNPQYYFGFSSWPGAPPEIVAKEREFPPQKLSKVNHAAKEWMIADAWWREGKYGGAIPELQQEGTYQSSWSGLAMPNFAPHFSGRTYSYSSNRSDDSTAIRDARGDGLTNTVFFDGHARSVESKEYWADWDDYILYGFPGTVNPLMAAPDETNEVWNGVWR